LPPLLLLLVAAAAASAPAAAALAPAALCDGGVGGASLVGAASTDAGVMSCMRDMLSRISSLTCTKSLRSVLIRLVSSALTLPWVSLVWQRVVSW
jgi:hypothetical protein